MLKKHYLDVDKQALKNWEDRIAYNRKTEKQQVFISDIADALRSLFERLQDTDPEGAAELHRITVEYVIPLEELAKIR